MKLKKYICLAVYYSFARYLPASASGMTRWIRKIRYVVCRSLFDLCGDTEEAFLKAYVELIEKSLYYQA